MKILHLAVIAAVTLFVGCASVTAQQRPEATAATVAGYSPHPSLKKQIDDIIEKQLLPYTNAAIKIYSLKKGDTLYELNSRLLLTPASNQKLFTSATALSVLGKDTPVVTTASYNPAAATIYLKGCGDSLLEEEDLADLARAVSRKVDHQKQYRVAADVSCFDDRYWGKGWMWDDEPDSDEMYITPLALHLNTVTVTTIAGKGAGMPATTRIHPDTPLVKVDNKAVTGRSDDADTVKVDRRPGDRDNAITVSGAIPAGSEPVVKHISVWRPERIALERFVQHLRAEGLTVIEAGNATTPAESETLAQKKRTVGDLVAFALKQSDNLSAESLIKLIGLKTCGEPGSAAAGGAAIASYLERAGIAVDRLVIADGSGVSRYNLTNADSIIKLLETVYREGIFPAFYNSLPVAGKDGTLAKRMKGTPAEGNVRAKTGNMEGVSALSGYLLTAEGEPLAFSIIIENFKGKAHPILEVQDAIASLLCRFSR